MGSRGNVVLKSGIWYTISNFLLRGMGLITTPIFTRLLTQEEYGAYNNYLSWVTILTVLVTLNVEATLISARYEHEEDLDQYIASVLALSMLSVMCWWGVFNVFMKQVSGLFHMNEVYINSIFVYLLMLPAVNLFQARERFFFRYKMSVALSMLLTIGTSFLSVILVIYMKNSLNGRIIGMVFPTVCIGGTLAIYFFYKARKISIRYWKETLKIVLPFIPHLLSLNVLNMMDRVMITNICGERETALYSLAYTVASVITIILGSLNGAFGPWLGEKLAEKKYSEIRTTSKGYILLFLYFAIGVMLLTPEILWILGGAAYIEAKWVMIPVSIGCICQFIYTLFVNVEQFQKKTVGMAFASVSAAILNFMLNSIFIPKFGYIAASFTTLAGYLWLLLIHMLLVYKMKMGHVYSYRFIFSIMCITCALSAGVYLLYIYNVARYLVLIMYGVFSVLLLAKKKTQIKRMLKKA